MGYYSEHYSQNVKDVLAEIDKALCAVDPESVERFVDAVLKADQVYFVGVGRVLLSLLVVGSGSGGSLFPLGIAKKAHSIGAKIVHIGSNPHSEMKDLCEFMVRIPVRTKNYLEDEIDSIQPMTSLFEQSLLLFGDVVAKMIIDERGLDMKSLWRYHANLE